MENLSEHADTLTSRVRQMKKDLQSNKDGNEDVTTYGGDALNNFAINGPSLTRRGVRNEDGKIEVNNTT